MYMYTVPAEVQRSIFGLFLSSSTVPPAAVPRRGGRRGSYSRKPTKNRPPDPGRSGVYVYSPLPETP